MGADREEASGVQWACCAGVMVMANDTRVARVLAEQGVFAGHFGLEGLADADEFWEGQPYGTRLYYGPGATDYLHRGVLRSAIDALRATSTATADGSRGGCDE